MKIKQWKRFLSEHITIAMPHRHITIQSSETTPNRWLGEISAKIFAAQFYFFSAQDHNA